MEPGRNLSLATLANFRDLGGYRTRDGSTVTGGLVFRSRALDVIDDHDLAEVGRHGITTVVDLRTRSERDAAPDRLGAGMADLLLDVLADSPDAAPTQLQEIETDPAAAQELLGDGRGIALFEHGYREFIELPSAHRAYGEFFRGILDSTDRVWLFHCTNGKDRTGWAAAALLLLCGVAQADVEHDFMLTNRDLLPAMQPVFDTFTAAGGDPALLRVALGVEIEYLRASMDQMKTSFGAIEGYFAEALGIDAGAQRALVDRLTTVG